jgi:hypothetical protein
MRADQAARTRCGVYFGPDDADGVTRLGRLVALRLKEDGDVGPGFIVVEVLIEWYPTGDGWPDTRRAWATREELRIAIVTWIEWT